MNIYSNLLLKNLIHIVIQYYKIYAFRKKNLHLFGIALSPLATRGGGGIVIVILLCKQGREKRRKLASNSPLLVMTLSGICLASLNSCSSQNLLIWLIRSSRSYSAMAPR